MSWPGLLWLIPGELGGFVDRALDCGGGEECFAGELLSVLAHLSEGDTYIQIETSEEREREVIIMSIGQKRQK